MKEKHVVMGCVAVMFSVALLLLQGEGCARTARTIEPAVAMTDLNNLEPLKEAFKRDRGTVRLVALLSPVCPMCRSGFADVQKVLKNISDARLKVYIVWLPMFPSDSKEWAQTRSEEFSNKRLSYYWDSERITGKEWQKVLGMKSVAWDVYLLYGAESQWDKELAAPDFWMHQLGAVTNAPRLDEGAFEAKAKALLSQVKK